MKRNKKNAIKSSNLRDIDYVQLIMEAYNWVEIGIEYRGSNPAEATYYNINNNVSLTLEFHQPLNLITLQIEGVHGANSLKLHFMFDNRPQRILEWIVSVQNDININNYTVLLKTAIGKCEMMLLELENKKIYEVVLPSK